MKRRLYYFCYLSLAVGCSQQKLMRPTWWWRCIHDIRNICSKLYQGLVELSSIWCWWDWTRIVSRSEPHNLFRDDGWRPWRNGFERIAPVRGEETIYLYAVRPWCFQVERAGSRRKMKEPAVIFCHGWRMMEEGVDATAPHCSFFFSLGGSMNKSWLVSDEMAIYSGKYAGSFQLVKIPALVCCNACSMQRNAPCFY